MLKDITRRIFLQRSIATSFGLALGSSLLSSCTSSNKLNKMEFGLVTYQWGKDWDLPTLIANCEKAGVKAVELRTNHAHGVETSLTKAEREEVKKRFANSSVTCVGYGSNYEYHDTDPDKLRWNIEQSKEYIKLCHDIGSTGL